MMADSVNRTFSRTSGFQGPFILAIVALGLLVLGVNAFPAAAIPYHEDCVDYRPSNPMVDLFSIDHPTYGARYHEGLFYVPGDSIRVFEFTEGSGFTHVNSLNTLGLSAGWIKLEGNRLYFDVLGFIWTVDITDPLNDQFVGYTGVEVEKQAFQTRGNLLYVCEDGFFKILDITDVYNIQIMDGAALPESPISNVVKLMGNYAIVGVSGSSIRVYDIEDPRHITPVSACFGDFHVRKMEIIGDHLITYGDSPGLQGFDLQDPENITNLGPVLENGRSFGSVGEYLFVPEDHGLGIYSVENFPQLEFKYLVPELVDVQDIQTYENRVFSCIHPDKIVFTDLNLDPTQAPPLFDVVLEDAWSNLIVHESLLFVPFRESNSHQGVRIYDSRGENNIEIIREISLPFVARDIGFSDNIIVLSSGGDLVTAHVSDFGNNPLLGTLDVWGLGFYEFVVEDDLVYCKGGRSVSVVSIDTPEAPRLLATYQMDDSIEQIGNCNDVIVVYIEDFGIKTMQMTYDTNNTGSHGTDYHLEAVGSLELGNQQGPMDMLCNDDMVFIGREGKIEIAHCGYPEQPKLLKTLLLPSDYSVCKLEYHGGYLYASLGEAGVAVIDVVDPGSAEIVGFINTMNRVFDVAIGNNQLFARGTSYNMKVFPLQCSDYFKTCSIDILPGSDENSISCSPQGSDVIPVALLTEPNFDALDVDHTTVRFGPRKASEAHSQDYGFIRREEDVDGDGDLDLLFNFRRTEAGIACVDDLAELTGVTYDGWPVSGTDMVITYGDHETNTTKSSLAVAPNPFNPRTTVSFRVDASQHVRVSVYDVRGLLVKVILDQVMDSGDHFAVWQGRNSSGGSAPSGEYFFMVESEGEPAIRKATLVR
ncbi:MAG: hypothetical protein GY780_05690 [bacterium]|nr:hypothetical protein [bacterium]